MSNLTNPRGSWAVRRGIARFPRFGIGLVAAAGALALGVAAIGPVSAQSLHATTNAAAAGGVYTAVTPTRLLDTRATDATLGGDGYYSLTVTGGTAGVPANATAVALNVTVTNTTDSGYLSVYPAGGTQPTVSNLNWVMGETVANSVIVPVGTAGQVTFFNHTGNTDVVADLEGYFTPQSTGTAGEYSPLTPARITDTRTGSGQPNAGDTLTAGGTLNVQVSGVGGVPAGATAAILNVTATDTTAASYFTAYPEGATRPTASNLNWLGGETVANRVVVPLGAAGGITLYNYVGSADAVIDVDGYFTNGTATLPSNASLYTSITPTRVLDTRTAGGTLGTGGIKTVALAGVGGIGATASAVVTNVTATNTTAASFFTVYPSTSAQPTASDVNWSAGQIVPNLTVATLGTTGSIDVYNHAGRADLVIDAFGYFTPVTAGGLTMISAVVAPTTITITYNEGVSCPATGADGDFTYYYSGGATGGSISGCTTSGDVLTLTGTFTLPGGTLGSISYTAPSPTNVSNSVYVTGSTSEFGATQTLAVTPTAAPTMLKATVTTSAITVTYNEPVVCGAGTITDFAYFYTPAVSSQVPTSCTPGVDSGATADLVTLGGTFTLPAGSTGTLVYTAPATNTAVGSVYATGTTYDYAATQTLAVTASGAPTMVSAVVTPGASGTGTIAVTYNEAVTCPTATDAAQTLFTYTNGGETAGGPGYPSTCTQTSGIVLTMGTFYSEPNNTTGETLAAPVAGDTLTYTAPTTNTTANAVVATSSTTDFAVTQSLAMAYSPLSMLNAVVTTSSIAITYNQAASCSATGTAAADFTYDWTIATTGGSATGCSAAGDVVTLTGTFIVPSGTTGSLAYTENGTSDATDVYATTNPAIYAASPQTIAGAAVS